MPRISDTQTYPKENTATVQDYLIGTDAVTLNTKTFTIAELKETIEGDAGSVPTTVSIGLTAGDEYISTINNTTAGYPASLLLTSVNGTDGLLLTSPRDGDEFAKIKTTGGLEIWVNTSDSNNQTDTTDADIKLYNPGAAANSLSIGTAARDTNVTIRGGLEATGTVDLGNNLARGSLYVNNNETLAVTRTGAGGSVTGVYLGEMSAYDVPVYLMQNDNPMITLSSTSLVGIGTTSPTTKLHVKSYNSTTAATIEGGDLVLGTSTSSDGDTKITIWDGVNAKALDFGVDSTTTAAYLSYNSNNRIKVSDDYITLIGDTAASINPAIEVIDATSSTVNNIYAQGNIYVGGRQTGYKNANLIMQESGNSIDFSITSDASGTNAATTSSKLDDYQEGTWVAVLTGTNVATSGQTGYWTKIGNKVTLTISIDAAHPTPGSTATLNYLTGIPFPASANQSKYSGNLGYITNLSGTIGTIRQCYLNQSDSRIYVNHYIPASGSETLNGYTFENNSTGTGKSTLSIELTYFV
jgi:hypothetical protein